MARRGSMGHWIRTVFPFAGGLLSAVLILHLLQTDKKAPVAGNSNGTGQSVNSGSNTAAAGGVFQASGRTRIKVGTGIRDNQLLRESYVLKANKEGVADVSVFAFVSEQHTGKVYFHFVDSYGFEQRSGEYTVPADARRYPVWCTYKLRRGSWKVTLKTAKGDDPVALSRFIVKSDLINTVLDGGKDPATAAAGDRTRLVLADWANGNAHREANLISSNRYGYGTVYAVSWVIVDKTTAVYFEFRKDKTVRRSQSYTVGVNPNGYRLWVYFSLPKGRWTAAVKDGQGQPLAERVFLIR